MIEIKFRAWDKEVCRMYPQNGVIASMTFDQNNECIHLGINEYEQINAEGEGSWRQYESTDFTLMQYTGLKDKNGVEIFEGDIVRYKETIQIDYESTEIRNVEFAGGSFYPLPVYKECEDDWYTRAISDYEIIGNIYENPELLKGKQ